MNPYGSYQDTVMAKSSVRVKCTTGVRGLSYVVNFHTARMVPHTLLYLLK